MPGVTPWTFIGLTVLTFFTATLGVIAGLGGGVLLLGVMATIFPPATVVPLHGTVLFGTNVGRSIIMRRMVLVPLIPAFAAGAIGGALVGGQLVVSLPTAVLQIILGAFILYVCWAPPPPATAYSRNKFFALGAIGMLIGMFVGASGSLLAPFVAAACPDRQQFVATHSVLMTLVHGLKILVFGLLGFAISAYLPLMVAMIGASFFGSYFGTKLLRRMPERAFRRVFQLVLSLLGLRLLYAGVSGMGWVS
ncbi:MAG: sulfite exporter TauE/SafE family protein [Alphaproteobacteria bacterium]